MAWWKIPHPSLRWDGNLWEGLCLRFGGGKAPLNGVCHSVGTSEMYTLLHHGGGALILAQDGLYKATPLGLENKYKFTRW